MRSYKMLPALLLVPAMASACGGPGGWGFASRADVVLTGVQRLEILLRTLLPVLVVLFMTWRWPTRRGRLAKARPTFLVFLGILWPLFLVAGIHTKTGFLFGPDTVGYGSFPLAAETALLLTLPLMARSLLSTLWSGLLALRTGSAPSPERPSKKPARDAGGREERGDADAVPTFDLAVAGALGAAGTLVAWAGLGLLEFLCGGRPFELLLVLTELPQLLG